MTASSKHLTTLKRDEISQRITDLQTVAMQIASISTCLVQQPSHTVCVIFPELSYVCTVITRMLMGLVPFLFVLLSSSSNPVQGHTELRSFSKTTVYASTKSSHTTVHSDPLQVHTPITHRQAMNFETTVIEEEEDQNERSESSKKNCSVRDLLSESSATIQIRRLLAHSNEGLSFVTSFHNHSLENTYLDIQVIRI